MQAPPDTTVPQQGRLLDVAGVAQWLGMTELQIRKLVERKQIPVTRIGERRIRFDIVEIDRWLKRSTEEPRMS